MRGIDPDDPGFPVATIRLPRMRGDRPAVALGATGRGVFTPHARGSTGGNEEMTRSAKVYPACAGIDPRGPCIVWLRACLPRMRGDRPKLKYYGERSGKFTPHARGSTRGELAGRARSFTLHGTTDTLKS